MKKFRFSLQKILDYKNQTLDVLMGELSEMRVRLKQIEEKIEQLEEYYSKLNRELREKYLAGVTVQEVASIKTYQNILNTQVKSLTKKKLDLLKLIGIKQQQIIEVKTSVASLDKLKEKQLVDYNKLLQKSEELFIDELVSHSIA